MNKNKCIVCNSKFNVSNGDQARRKFCSNKCRTYFFNRNSKGKQNFCVDCNVQINLNSTRCRKCHYLKRDLSGEKNGRWKGGTSEGYQISIYRSILRENGVNIDVCAKCGVLKGNTKRMCIHHIDGNHNNNTFSNLIPLCSRCHLGIHKKKDPIIKKCVICGKEFQTTNKKVFHCSKSCSNSNRTYEKTGKIKTCIVCGKQKYFSRADINRSRCEFCSQICHYSHRKQNKEKMKEWSKKMLELKQNK